MQYNKLRLPAIVYEDIIDSFLLWDFLGVILRVTSHENQTLILDNYDFLVFYYEVFIMKAWDII